MMVGLQPSQFSVFINLQIQGISKCQLYQIKTNEQQNPTCYNTDHRDMTD